MKRLTQGSIIEIHVHHEYYVYAQFLKNSATSWPMPEVAPITIAERLLSIKILYNLNMYRVIIIGI